MKTIKYLLSVLTVFAISACTELTPGVDEIVYESTSDSSSGTSSSSTNKTYVDLGLSVKWAACNIGASKASDYGNFYAWGEVSTKSSYTSSNSSTYGSSISDYSGKSAYDVATKTLGSHWRTPTQEEAEELAEECTWTWTTMNSVNGFKVTGSNGKYIFIPAAGYKDGTSTENEGTTGSYWLSTPIDKSDAYNIFFGSSWLYIEDAMKWRGHTVRAVYDN